jgi:RNA polymerase sigma factor (sigma-70 family)
MSATDGNLLEKYSKQNDQTAFEEILRRHSPMVMGVCQRVLGDPHSAQDAFQATFLILARKAGTMTTWETTAGWLYKVALRTAYKLKSKRAAQFEHESQMEDIDMLEQSSSEPDRVWEEAQPILDTEMNRLPEKYRFPLILCYLEGQSYQDAANQLGLPFATLKIRLERGRTLLRSRLHRQGVVLSAGLLATLLAKNGSAAVPAAVLSTTLKSAAALSTTKVVAAGLATGKVATLANGVMKSMLMEKIAVVSAASITIATITATTPLIYQKLSNSETKRASTQQMEPTIRQLAEAPVNASLQAARILINQLFNEIEATGITNRGQILQLLKPLTSFEEDGSRAIQEFLQSQKDVALVYNQVAERTIQPSTFRVALLEVLQDKSDPTARTTNLEVLRSASSGLEALLAVRNIEKFSPNQYRSDALKTALEILTRANENTQATDIANVIQIVKYYHGVELLPQIEAMAPKKVEVWLNVISQFEGEVQSSSLSRALSNDATRKEISQHPHALLALNLNNKEVRQVVKNAFTKEMTIEQQQKFLGDLGDSVLSKFLQEKSAVLPSKDSPKSINLHVEVKSLIQLLGELEPQLAPSLQQSFQSAKEKLKDGLSAPSNW